MTVAVVGLGIAGMRAAMLLEQAGHEVLLFEARDRLGGRMETTDHGDGTVYESGGEWIDSDHTRCLALLRELGLAPEPAPPGERLYTCHGTTCTPDTLWPDAMEDEIRFHAAARELCRNLRQPAWANTHLQHLDHATLATFIDQHAQSPNGRWLLTAQSLSDEGDDPDQIGLLGWLSFYLYYTQREGDEMSAFRIPGGASELFTRMSQFLRARAELGKELSRVQQDDEGVTLEFSDGSVARADRLVTTLPSRPLERLAINPALSPGKRCAVEACRMSPVIKICLQFDQPWWTEIGWSGAMQCDFPIQQTWTGGPSILTCYICGRAARTLAADPNPVYRALESLVQLYPQAQAHFTRGWLHDWISDPYAGGGFSHLAPGYVLQHMQHIGTAEGRIHFAGEHTSTWTGFIEGALESAERVVEEICQTG